MNQLPPTEGHWDCDNCGARDNWHDKPYCRDPHEVGCTNRKTAEQVDACARRRQAASDRRREQSMRRRDAERERRHRERGAGTYPPNTGAAFFPDRREPSPRRAPPQGDRAYGTGTGRPGSRGQRDRRDRDRHWEPEPPRQGQGGAGSVRRPPDPPPRTPRGGSGPPQGWVGRAPQCETAAGPLLPPAAAGRPGVAFDRDQVHHVAAEYAAPTSPEEEALQKAEAILASTIETWGEGSELVPMLRTKVTEAKEKLSKVKPTGASLACYEKQAHDTRELVMSLELEREHLMKKVAVVDHDLESARTRAEAAEVKLTEARRAVAGVEPAMTAEKVAELRTAFERFSTVMTAMPSALANSPEAASRAWTAAENEFRSFSGIIAPTAQSESSPTVVPTESSPEVKKPEDGEDPANGFQVVGTVGGAPEGASKSVDGG